MRYLMLVLMLILSALPALAHSDEEHDDDDVTAVEVGEVVIPEHPTYHEHVRPIIAAKCNDCHSAGGIAAYAPFDNPDDVVWASADIRFHVVNGIMPPWPPSRAGLPLQHDRSLSDEEIALIAAWVDAGAPLGDPHDYAPDATDAFDIPEIRADLTLQLDEPYLPDADLLDDYRCFAYALDIDAPQFITGYDIVPEALEMAHHALVYVLEASAWTQAEAKASEDGKPGWPCYGGPGLRQRARTIGGWTPGAFGVELPPGGGHRIEQSQFIVLQMHYNLWATRQPDNTRILLQLADGASELDELTIMSLPAPVEIPCPAGVEGPQCEREAALQRVGDLYGSFASRLPNRLLRVCNQTVADYADNTGERSLGQCDFPVRNDSTLYGVLGHMHELGRSFRLELNPDSDESLLLLDIPRWDFHWQGQYLLAQPIMAERGDVLRMTCEWDNSLADEPRYVVWGEGTNDEMCFATVLAQTG